jgi:hypothetical protein
VTELPRDSGTHEGARNDGMSGLSQRGKVSCLNEMMGHHHD